MRKHLLPSVFLVVLSAAVTFFHYSSIPQHIAFDEIAFTKLALSLERSPYVVYSSLFTGHSTLYFYILLLSFKIFGVSIFALRIPSALFGIFSVVLFYFIMNRIFKNSFFAFFLSCTLLFLRWYINFSRFSFEATFLLFLELLSTFFLFKFLEDKKTKNVLLSGSFSGLAFHSYYPGRVFFLLPLFFLLLHRVRKYALLFLLAFVLVASPLIFYLVRHPDIRIAQVSLFSNKNLSPQEKMKQLGLNIKKTTLMFHVEGDMNGRHNYPGKPAINPILGILFLGGLVLALKDYLQIYNQYFLLYFLLSIILPLANHTQDNPNMLRAFTAIPGIVYFIGKAYIWMWQFKKFIKKKIVIGLIVIVFVLSAMYELRTYFLFQSRVFRNSFEILCSLPEVVQYDIKNDIRTVPRKCRVSRNLF